MAEIQTFILALQDNGGLVQLVLFLLALAVIWIVLRFVLRFAIRVFTRGCLLLALLGLLLIFLHYLG